MSLLKNVAGQHFTFALLNATTGAALTGATPAGFVSKDGGAQASTAGTFTELGNGAYDYAPTQAETNANHVGFLITATSAYPFNIPFFTAGGLHRNVSGQHVTFAMVSTSGVADTGATVSPFVSKDGGVQAAGGGSTTNLGNGQYDYAITQAESNGTRESSFLFSATGDTIQNTTLFTIT